MSSTPFLTRLGLNWLGLGRFGENRRLWNSFYRHSRTFSLAARLLPRHVRRPVATLYLFCRRIDTIADERAPQVGTERAREELEQARRNLEATLDGCPPEETLWQRLGEVHRRFALPPGPLGELIDGARWDLEGRPVESAQDLLEYSMLVGGSVGAMMLPFLAPQRQEHLDAPARTLGVAMQITNIVRDVGEDLRLRNRCYLPSAWLEKHGLSAGKLHDELAGGDGSVPAGYPAVLERAMRAAETRYRTGTGDIRALPPRMRLGIRSAARMYREIHNEVRANGYDNLSRRAYTSLPRKLRLVVQDDYRRRRERLLGPADGRRRTADHSEASV